MNGESIILQFEPLNPSNIAGLDFSKPFVNNIMVMSGEYLIGGSSRTYYGDEIDLHFWSFLMLSFGTYTLPGSPMTLTPGYRYVYNHTTRDFDVYDSSSTNILHISNIENIAQMNIDFTIMNSHQFEIIASPTAIGISKFVFPAILLNEKLSSVEQDSIACGIDNKYLADRVRPYLPTDIDNPSFSIRHIAGDDFNFGESYYSSVCDTDVTKLEGINYFWNINFEKTVPSNYVYLTGLHVDKKVQQYEEKHFTDLEITTVLNGLLSKNLYPYQMNVVRPGEIFNNRPVYEPWLMVWFRFLYNPLPDSAMELISAFDLSPRWT